MRDFIFSFLGSAVLLAACSQRVPNSQQELTALPFVIRSEAPIASADADSIIVLTPLDKAPEQVYFAFFSSEEKARRAGRESYRMVMRIGGLADEPSHAVYAGWELDDTLQANAFEQSREELFKLRAQYLESFHADLLLQSSKHPSQYLILGLYANEDGLRQAREHPRIQEYSQQNPPGRFGARDLYGVRNFYISRP